MYYFAYGSNMDKEDLDKWCEEKGHPKIKFLSVLPAKLKGYKLTFNYFSTSRNGGAANIMKSEGDCVYGLLIELTEDDLKTIRIKEGCPNNYKEIEVSVEEFDGTVVQGVKTYKVVKEHEKIKHQPPTKYYMQLIIRNARRYNFPDNYIDFLESIKTRD